MDTNVSQLQYIKTVKKFLELELRFTNYVTLQEYIDGVLIEIETDKVYKTGLLQHFGTMENIKILIIKECTILWNAQNELKHL